MAHQEYRRSIRHLIRERPQQLLALVIERFAVHDVVQIPGNVADQESPARQLARPVVQSGLESSGPCLVSTFEARISTSSSTS